MKKYDEAIKKALEMHTHKDQYCYFFGAKGQVMTDQTMDALIKAEPAYFSKYSAKQLQDIKNFSRGKIGFDCSGFVKYITGCSAWYSAAQWAQCTNKTSDLAQGVAGSILYKTGHIGIDIGWGFFVHVPVEGQSVEIGRIKEYNWTGSGQINCLDYTGADGR